MYLCTLRSLSLPLCHFILFGLSCYDLRPVNPRVVFSHFRTVEICLIFHRIEIWWNEAKVPICRHRLTHLYSVYRYTSIPFKAVGCINDLIFVRIKFGPDFVMAKDGRDDSRDCANDTIYFDFTFREICFVELVWCVRRNESPSVIMYLRI